MSGAWTYNHNAVSGVPLLICWVFESAFLLAGGVLLPVKMMLNDDPSCVCGAQCRRVPRLPRFATDRQDEFVASIENREYSAMETHLPPAHEDHPEISLRLMSCPRCGKTHVLTVNRIEWRRTANRTFLQTTPLINQMMISDEATQEIRTLCEKIKLERAAKLKIT